MQNNSKKNIQITITEWQQAQLKKDYVILFMVIIGIVLELNKQQPYNWLVIIIPIIIIQTLYIYLTERLNKKWQTKD